MPVLTMAKALNAGLRRALEADPKVVLAGEDVGKLGGVFRVTEGLQKDFGDHRVIDSPLAESGIVGTAVGMAPSRLSAGVRDPVRWVCLSRLRPNRQPGCSAALPFRRTAHGADGDPNPVRWRDRRVEHHSESPEAYFAHTVGLKVVTCSNPVDAYWMIQQAVASDDPIIFFEPKRRYHEKAEVDEAASPLPLHAARVTRPGSDLTLLAYGPMVRTCLEAAEAAAQEGRELEVVDLRSLSPLDMAVVADSVQKTGRAITVHEAPVDLALGAELAARITEECFYSLEAPVLRVGGIRHALSAEPGRGGVPS